MKVKEAIELIKNSPMDGQSDYQRLCQLFRQECDDRIQSRVHKSKPTQSLVEGVIKEVKDWVVKVSEGIELSDEEKESILKYEPETVYAKYRLIEPKAEKQIKDMQRAYLMGRPPIEALTNEGLNAITSMILGSMVADVTKLVDKPFCPYGVAARFCPKQETYSDSRKGLPTSVDDIQFFCTIDPANCDWKGAKDE